VDDDRSWTSPSALAEYAFCPRAHFYRLHECRPASPETVAGSVYHDRRLSAERWRSAHRRVPWFALVLGVVLVTGALLALLL